jgi:hypothetical protein
MKPLLTLQLDVKQHVEHCLQCDTTQIAIARTSCAQLAARVFIYAPPPQVRDAGRADELATVLLQAVLCDLQIKPQQVMSLHTTRHLLQDAAASVLIVLSRMEGEDHEAMGHQRHQQDASVYWATSPTH